MSARYLIRESHQGRVVPRCDLGLQPSRRAAKALAASMGLPVNLSSTEAGIHPRYSGLGSLFAA